MFADDWHSLPGHSREKYQLYLCSPEWGALRRAAAMRANGWCERCHMRQGAVSHHRTCVRRYFERLDDLAWICDDCHNFIHGRLACDPRLSQPRRFQWRPSSRHNRGGFSPYLIRRAEFRAIRQNAVLWMLATGGIVTWLWPDFPRWFLAMLAAAQ